MVENELDYLENPTVYMKEMLQYYESFVTSKSDKSFIKAYKIVKQLSDNINKNNISGIIKFYEKNKNNGKKNKI